MTEQQKRLKILAIVPTSFCYGLQHITLDFFGELSKDIDSHFLITRWNNGEFVKELNKKNISYSYSWLGMFSRKSDWYNLKMSLHALIKLPKLYYDTIKILLRFKPDIVYTANHHELILLYPLLIFLRKPVICHMHDPAPNIKFQKITFKFYGKLVDHFIAISNDVKERTKLLGCNENKITVIHNGIKLSASARITRGNKFVKDYGWPEDAFIIGITGQMTATKGHEDLISAISVLSISNDNIYLIIGGKKIEPYYSELINLINELNLTNKIKFSGWQNDVIEFFNNIDLLVMPSRHDEGYGLVAAEAMACYKPVIATASGGVVEIIDNNVTGFIIPKRDSNILADKINLLVTDKGLKMNMGLAGRKRIETHFDFYKKSKLLKNLLWNIKNKESI